MGRMARKCLALLCSKIKDFHNEDGVRAPTFIPCEPFSLGIGVVFNMLIKEKQSCCRTLEVLLQLLQPCFQLINGDVQCLNLRCFGLTLLHRTTSLALEVLSRVVLVFVTWEPGRPSDQSCALAFRAQSHRNSETRSWNAPPRAENTRNIV